MTPEERAALLHSALLELIHHIDEVEAYVDLEAGQEGDGAVVRACKAAGINIPPNLAAWLAQDDAAQDEQDDAGEDGDDE